MPRCIKCSLPVFLSDGLTLSWPPQLSRMVMRGWSRTCRLWGPPRAARALMRLLQDIGLTQCEGLARGVFQRVTGSTVTDLYSPRRLFSLTGDDCFQVGKVMVFRERADCSALFLSEINHSIWLLLLIHISNPASKIGKWALSLFSDEMKKLRVQERVNDLPKVTQV